MPPTISSADQGIIPLDSPPAYELSQQEFDDKTSRAILTSHSDPPPKKFDTDGFEIWDDAIFDAQRTLNKPCEDASECSQLRSLTGDSDGTASSSSRLLDRTSESLSSTFKRSERILTRRKQRSALRVVGNEVEEETMVPPLPNGTTRTVDVPPEEPPLSPNTDRTSSPPPVFTPVGPSLDGPAYEEVVLTFERTAELPRPPSPQNSDPDAHSTIRHSVYSSMIPHERSRMRQAMPFDGIFLSSGTSRSSMAHTTSPASRQNAVLLQQARNSHTTPIPHIAFDPKLAYVSQGKNTPDTISEPRTINSAALAFYR